MKLRVVLCLLVLSVCGCDETPTTPSPTSCTYLITPVQFTPCMPASQGTVSVVAQDGCVWTPNASAAWIAVAGTGARSGAGTFTFTVLENYVAPRESTIEVTWPGSASGQSVRVAQAGCLYTLNPPAAVIPAAGADGAFVVHTMALPNECGGPTQNACVWTAQSASPWLTIVSGWLGGDGDRVQFRVAANDSPTSRTGTIAVRDKQFQVTQAGR